MRIANKPLLLLFISFTLICPSALAQDGLSPAVTEPGNTEFDFASRILTGRTFPVDVRQDAAALLLRRAWPRGSTLIANILIDSDDPQGRLAVAAALAQTLPKLDALPEDFIEPLLATLSAKDEKLRDTAALAVANYGPQTLTQLGRLILLPEPDTPETTRLAAVAAVERIKDKTSAKILIDALDDNNVQLSSRCRQGLELLTGIRFGQSNAAWRQWWQQYKDKDLAEWLQLYILALDSQNLQLRTRVSLLADQLKKQIEFRWLNAQDKAKFLEQLLANPLDDVRLQGLTLSRNLFQPGPFPANLQDRLRQMIAAESPPVRSLATELLRDLRDKQAGKIILTRLPDETDPRVRASFARALGYVGGADGVQPLIALLTDPSPLVVAGAASALGTLASSEDLGSTRSDIVQALLARYEKSALANGSDVTLRGEILSAMVRLNSPAFRPVFVQALKEASALTRARAVEGLRTLPPDDLRKQTLAAVEPLLADSDRGVRLEALRTIETLGGPQELPVLEARLDPKIELDPNVRQEVWRVILLILGKADLQTLTAWQQRITDDDPERQEQLLRHIENMLSQANPPSSDLIAVREKLGDALARLGRWEPATGKYGLAFDQALVATPDHTELRGRLALKLLDALLHQGDFPQAVAHIQDVTSSLPIEQEALTKALDYLQALLDSANTASAAQLLTVLDKASLPGLSKDPLKDRFELLKAQTRTLAQP